MTSLCLEQLLTNKKSCSLVLINDTIKLSALPILTDVAKQSLEENKNLIVLLTETSPSFWKQQFHSDKVKDMFIIDTFSNPRGWDEFMSEKDSNVLQVNDIDNMEELILAPIMKKVTDSPNCTILIDSITPLALISQRRAYQLLKALESLTTDSIRLMVGYHSDIKLSSRSGLNMQDSLKRLASVIIVLEAIKEKTQFETQAALTGFIPQDTFSYLTVTSNSVVKGGIANIEWRKKSGKVTYESNGFIFNDKTKRLDVIAKNQLVHEKKDNVEEELTTATESMKIDPTANLSFNLSLTEEQRKAKENLILPHYKAQQLEVSIDEEKKQGLIYYDPDAADDFDDEDPDDDLDI